MSTKCQSYSEDLCLTFSYGSTSITSNNSCYTSPSQADGQLRSTAQNKKTDMIGQSNDTGRCAGTHLFKSGPKHGSNKEGMRIHTSIYLAITTWAW
ncbi:hypothetical protein CDAR_508061 [Caerostris darwini]|uniref:Uncharacterized protein n=1 Tax=Caerostris darwini TaxID=1538125 RepID=A0AAV4WRS3_9ARAC|nr:hypothetical protein CDAR_508061 [Caerostris darwini]